MARETKQEKAVRLVAEQRVRFLLLRRGKCSATVAGESGDYATTFDGRWACTCMHGANSNGLCSHALAAQIIYRAVLSALEE